MKFKILIGILAIMSCLQLAIAADYYIYSWTDLQNINNGHLDDDCYLMNDLAPSDIDYAVINGEPDGFFPIGNYSIKFSGNFDGKNHTITGLFIYRPSLYEPVGLFGYAAGAAIKSIMLENVNITGGNAVGGLAGSTESSSIENSYVEGSVEGDTPVGGLVGYNYLMSSITKSHSACTVKGSISRFYAGGLVGINEGSFISDSYSESNVTGRDVLGGLVGYNGWMSVINNSYALGSITGNDWLGGLVGQNNGAVISNAYSECSVSGNNYVGGVVGNNEWGAITNSYWDVSRSGRSNCAGYGSSGECTPINNENSQPDYFLHSENPPMNEWNFSGVWGIFEGESHPFLIWENRGEEEQESVPELNHNNISIIIASVLAIVLVFVVIRER